MNELYLKVFERDGWNCRHCSFRVVHPHHIIFRSQGGPDDMRNLITLCPSCHEAVHAKNLEIEVLTVLEENVIVRFTRLNGWKP